MNYTYISNLFEPLIYKLQERLFEKRSPLRKLVIVPSPLIKKFLYHKVMRQRKICTGFKVMELLPAVDYLMRLCDFKERGSRNFPAPMLLSLHIELLMKQLCNQNSSLLHDRILEPLLFYVGNGQQEGKIQDLSDAISMEFLHRGVFGASGLKQWLEGPVEEGDWQRCLWDLVFDIWEYPKRAIENICADSLLNLDMEVHIFGFSFIPQIYEMFFEKLSHHVSFYHYFLSPCQLFWGDFCSERKQHFLKRMYEKKGVSSGKIQELDKYLKSYPKLLSNFGTLSQKRFNRLLDIEGEVEEYFVIPSDKDKSLLQHIRENLLEACDTPHTKTNQEISLQIHEAPSKKREVEIMLSAILDITYRQDIRPSEILVLSPDIGSYFPFIYEVFQARGLFAIEVQDLELLSQSQLLQGIWHIMCLETLRWEIKDIFKLLTFDPLLKKLTLSQDDVLLIKTWCQTSHIKWGYNREHRCRLLGLDNASDAALDGSEAGTWKYALERLLFGVAVAETAVEPREYFPLTCIEMSQAPLLGIFIDFIDRLYADITILSSQKKTILDWLPYLKGLVEKYFEVGSDNKEQQSLEFFYEQLKVLQQLPAKILEEKVSFSTLKRYFKKAFYKKSGVYSQGNKESIKFGCLKPGQIHDAKVIAFLGMQEDAFPRERVQHPFQQIDPSQMEDYPTTLEEDRQSILEALLCAKEALIMTYCSQDAKDGHKKNPSFLLEELIEYCGKEVNIVYHHPQLPFNKWYFSKENPFFNFSLRDYELAKRYYADCKETHPLFPEFYHVKDSIEDTPCYEDKIIISLKDLKTFAKNPLQHYFNKKLGIYLEKEERDPLEEEFVMSSLDKYLFKMNNMGQDFNALYEKQELLGATPLGLFKEIAKIHLEDNKKDFEQALQLLNIDLSRKMTVEMSLGCSDPYLKQDLYWVIPPIAIELEQGSIAVIHGVFDNVFAQGFLHQGKDSLEEIIKIWPAYLAFHIGIADALQGEIQPNLLCAKGPTVKSLNVDPKKALRAYLEYYLNAQQHPSPLLPLWSQALLCKPQEELQDVVKKKFSQRNEFVDDYHQWSFEHMEPFCAKAMCSLWKLKLKNAFTPFLTWMNKEEPYA